MQVTADGEGRLWLIVGTDSGFEGLSAFYYARIACTLTPVEPRDSEASLLGFDRSPDRQEWNLGPSAAARVRPSGEHSIDQG